MFHFSCNQSFLNRIESNIANFLSKYRFLKIKDSFKEATVLFDLMIKEADSFIGYVIRNLSETILHHSINSIWYKRGENINLFADI